MNDNSTSPLRYEIRASEADPDAAPLAAGVFFPGDQIEFQGTQFSIEGTPAVADSFAIRPAGTESIFATLKRLSETLRSPLATPAETERVGDALQGVLQQLDGSINSLSDARSTTGSRLLTLQQINEFRTEQMDIARESLAKISDVDFAEAIARLNQQITALQVAQQTYAKANTASLFDYL